MASCTSRPPRLHEPKPRSVSPSAACRSRRARDATSMHSQRCSARIGACIAPTCPDSVAPTRHPHRRPSRTMPRPCTKRSTPWSRQHWDRSICSASTRGRRSASRWRSSGPRASGDWCSSACRCSPIPSGTSCARCTRSPDRTSRIRTSSRKRGSGTCQRSKPASTPRRCCCASPRSCAQALVHGGASMRCSTIRCATSCRRSCSRC